MHRSISERSQMLDQERISNEEVPEFSCFLFLFLENHTKRTLSIRTRCLPHRAILSPVRTSPIIVFLPAKPPVAPLLTPTTRCSLIECSQSVPVSSIQRLGSL